jgi:hypothetical protein
MKLEARPNKFGDFYVYQLDEGPERVIARFTAKEEADHYIDRKHRLAAKQAGIPADVETVPAAEDIPKPRKKPGPKPKARTA